jgi:hypothetical protein
MGQTHLRQRPINNYLEDSWRPRLGLRLWRRILKPGVRGDLELSTKKEFDIQSLRA